MKLSGKRALITGGTRGIGAAIALDLASQGVDVAINSRTQDDAADETIKALQQYGHRVCFVAANMAVGEDARRCVTETVAELGGLDILVHNAGGPASGKIEDLTAEQWHNAFDVHVHAAFHLCQEALPELRKNSEGSIIFMSSVAGIRGCPGALVYGTVKGTILHFTRMLARDLADDNIRVNCVNPGIIRTRFHEKMTSEAQAHNLANRIPLHREGTSEQVAEAVRLLVTNDFMTGESITVDGGMSMQVTR
ncbi:MAG: SDR family NAD(P)-dependent oxidoreductase [Planctomycetota bacterium]